MIVVIAAALREDVRRPRAEARSEVVLAGVVTPRPEPARGAQNPATAPPRDVRLTVAVSGDILAHLPVVRRARALAGSRGGYDFAPLLAPLRPLINAADLAICHVETPLQAGSPVGYPRFRTPPELASAIHWTGWDACSTASNHTLDQGEAGVRSTVQALDRAGVAHTGSYRSALARSRPLLLPVRGVTVAFMSYTATTNGLPLPRPWSVNLAEPERILADARRARRRGADAVLVNLHWGTEYRHSPDQQQLALARRLAASKSITAVVGQHAHVVQPIRRVDRGWVVFGSGNLLSNQSAACCSPATQDGMIVGLQLRVRGNRDTVTRIDYTPTWVRHPDFTVLPVGRALGRSSADRAALRASWTRTVGIVGRSRQVRPVPSRLP
ncbi:MAG: CapA family protein [Solirubrobacterales bacterium]|nr:CapA family protein [Solirubrobacterales bacterium]